MLVGVVHLPPLSGSPRNAISTDECAKLAAADARALAAAGFDAVVVENFGDAPFFGGAVPPVTVAAMTSCALAVRAAAPTLALGINVLRNDGCAAIAVASVVGAAFVRINVLAGARVTDQGIVQGEAATVLRLRRELGATAVAIWADVDVKHSSPLGAERPLDQEVADVTERSLADVVLVTGEGTSKAVDRDKLAAVKRASPKPVFVASGATIGALETLATASDGIIVGSALRRGGVPGGPIDAELAREFARAYRALRPA